MLNGIPEQSQIVEKHPKALRIMFLTEMWERFSFYGMRALLVLYLTKHLKQTDDEAGLIYGIYNALVYFTPLPGGYLADNYLGNRRSILLGALIMMFGHCSLAIESDITLYLGLGLLILGNGFFKPNMTSMLGELYRDRPELKDSGYMLFYVGINLGAFLGFLICGYVGERINWHYGFGLAGIGMLFGLLLFYFGQKTLGDIGNLKNETTKKKHDLEADKVSGRIGLILILAFFHTMFWVIYEQTGSSINLFTDRNVDRMFFGIEIPTSSFQSINPILIMFFGPFLSRFWFNMSRDKKEISIPTKFYWSFIFAFSAYIALYIGTSIYNVNVPSIWIFIFYFGLTLGELHISPVGLSMVSKIAPRKLMGLIVGVWFLSISLAQYLAGIIGGRFGKYMSYAEFFLALGVLGLLCAIVLFFVKERLVKKIEEYS
ncbi:MAG: peptide MFS transporter [Leptospiraceae bacterium]|nr:peptide MFS transporter [Leptospiraceae bacterium]